MPQDDLEPELARYLEITSTAVARERAEAGPAIAQASRVLYDELNRIWQSIGLQQAGEPPYIQEWRCNERILLRGVQTGADRSHGHISAQDRAAGWSLASKLVY